MATILYVGDNDDDMSIVHRRRTLTGFEAAVVRKRRGWDREALLGRRRAAP